MSIIQKFIKHPYVFWVCIAGATILVLFAHIWLLDSVPQGLYVDESSIGLNAASIAKSMHDEHGRFLPTYFEAFGEYKNPIYIYTASLLFLLFGINDFILRTTSFVFYLIFLAGFVTLVRQLFPQNRLLLLYSIISAGFLPWVFSLSRISFEVISQPAIMVWALYFLIVAYTDARRRFSTTLYSFVAGSLVGLSVYAYSTSRVLSFCLLAIILLLYYNKKYWKRHAYMLAGCLILLIPYIIFSISNPGALTHRFNLLTYVFDAQLSLIDKLSIFISNYLAYYDLGFLVLSGDPNLRHHTGFTGEVFIAVFALFILGIWALSSRLTMSNSDKRTVLLLLLCLLSAPIPAALTEPNHSLRSLMMAPYILIISLSGLATLQRIKHKLLRYTIVITLLLVLIIESALYAQHYFTEYPAQSINAFESYDLKQDLVKALAYKPQDIIVTKYANQPYAHLDYYRYQLPLTIPSYIAEPVAAPKRCIIYFIGGELNLDDKNLEIGTEDSNYYSRLRCYK